MSYLLSERSLLSIPCLLNGVDTASQWHVKRSDIMSVWMDTLGLPPVFESADNFPSTFTVVGETEEADHRRLDIRFGTLDGDVITALLLLPGRAARGKCPAVLALHPTSPDGSADVATPSGRENRRYGLELVSRGYVVLAPDSVTFGKRVYPGTEPFQTAPFYERRPEWTVVGKMLADHRRALDVLCSMEEVDAHRIGAIGHSLGGYNGWFLAGMDPRVRAVVSSCGFSMFTDDPEPNRWGRRDWFSHFPVITDLIQEDRIPFEWHEIAALAAPTPMLMWSGLNDPIFPNWHAIASGMDDVSRLYRFLGAEERFQFLMGNAGHDFPERIRSLAYAFLDQWLFREQP